MAFTSKDFKAIGWYGEVHKTRPTLTIYPLVRFENGDEIDIHNLTARYQVARKQEKRA